MNQSLRYEKHVSRLHRNIVQKVGDSAAVKCRTEFFPVKSVLQTVNQLCSRLGFDYVPHFGFYRMYLNRKTVPGVYQLYHYREFFASEILRQKHSRIFSVFDAADALRMNGKLPCLGCLAGRLVVFFSESRSAPDYVLVDGDEFKRVDFFHVVLR